MDKIDKKNHRIFNNMYELFKNTNIKNEKKSIVFLINNPCGMGSAITVFLENAFYIKECNPSIIIIPHFSQNYNNFKYHEPGEINSFFSYFNYNKNININDYKYYFAHSVHYEHLPFFKWTFPLNTDNVSVDYIKYFKDNFTLKNKNVCYDFINKIKFNHNNFKLFGIHIRSYFQKKAHNSSYCKISLKDRLITLKNKINTEINKENYIIFIATDVSFYIDIVKDVFATSCYFLPDIFRINNELDSIPNINYCGLKLGNDIFNDCFCLSLCDKIYVSSSNIPYIVECVSDKNIENKEYVYMEEY